MFKERKIRRWSAFIGAHSDFQFERTCFFFWSFRSDLLWFPSHFDLVFRSFERVFLVSRCAFFKSRELTFDRHFFRRNYFRYLKEFLESSELREPIRWNSITFDRIACDLPIVRDCHRANCGVTPLVIHRVGVASAPSQSSTSDLRPIYKPKMKNHYGLKLSAKCEQTDC